MPSVARIGPSRVGCAGSDATNRDKTRDGAGVVTIRYNASFNRPSGNPENNDIFQISRDWHDT
jgi:hypothetical protein